MSADHVLGHLGIERLLDLSPLVIVGMAGAALQCFKRWQGWKNFLLSVATSGFGALLVGELARGMSWPGGIAFFVAGMIGYSGGSLVDSFLERTEARIEGEAKR